MSKSEAFPTTLPMFLFSAVTSSRDLLVCIMIVSCEINTCKEKSFLIFGKEEEQEKEELEEEERKKKEEERETKR